MSPLRATASTWSAEEHERTRRAAVAGCVGTLIEYYDFSLYGYMAVIIAPLFFPGGNATVSLLSSLAVFATAYVVRPLGGIFFGHIGDRHGRKTALVATLVCMGIGSTLMGLLPTHASAGTLAPTLLVLIRLFQGFSAGGEVGGAATFIAESTPPHLKAKYGAFTPMGSTGGFALAAMVAGAMTSCLTKAEMSDWGWRVPFLLAFPLTLLCLWARTRVKETRAGTREVAERHSPVIEVFRRQPWAVLQAASISASTNVASYIGLTYISIHLIQRLGYPASSVYWIATIAIGISALLMPLGGLLGDRIGLHRLMALGLGGYAVLTYPMMSLMSHGLTVAAVAFLVIMLNTVSSQIAAYTVLPTLFDQAYRYTGVATGFNLGVIVGGGTAPFAAVWMVEKTGNTLAPAYFVIVAAIVGLVTMATISRQIKSSYRLAA